jgi:hypothetical protein
MSKRMTDSDIWKKQWHRQLSPILKCFWKYVCDNCDRSGVWEIDMDLAEFQIGGKISIDSVLEKFSSNIVKINNHKLLVIDFIDYQFGQLKKITQHSDIWKLLEKHGISYPFKHDTLPNTLPDTLPDTHQDKIKTRLGLDKDKEKEQQPEKIKYLDYVFLTQDEHGRVLRELG